MKGKKEPRKKLSIESDEREMVGGSGGGQKRGSDGFYKTQLLWETGP